MDPDPDRALSVWRADLDRGAVDDPAETRRRLDAQECGDAVIVQLGIFADVVDGDELRRVDGIHVGGLWFERGRSDENFRHATEIVVDRVEAIRDDLRRHGVPASSKELAALPIKIELDSQLEGALTGRSLSGG
ncbi:MAG: hypothetical protein ACJ760_12355 [Thermoleophilaceae bacterium]